MLACNINNTYVLLTETINSFALRTYKSFKRNCTISTCTS